MPTIFGFLIILSEIVNSLQEAPNEAYDAVRQWTPWLQTCLVLVATIINRYHIAWIRKHRWRQLLDRLQPSKYPVIISESSKGYTFIGEVRRQSMAAGLFVYHTCTRTVTVAVDAWRDGREWLSDPDYHCSLLVVERASPDVTAMSSAYAAGPLGAMDGDENDSRIKIRALAWRKTRRSILFWGDIMPGVWGIELELEHDTWFAVQFLALWGLVSSSWRDTFGQKRSALSVWHIYGTHAIATESLRTLQYNG
ncbi:MAG: hypothetical protein M1814_002847 [Vezdaea aestivalis]|nr:MAG: hypothetical protein M1814_002847 [Vezdaea aestivalis]